MQLTLLAACFHFVDRAFDFGVYVLVSSVDPLRIYRYDREVLLRFCLQPYYPFDPSNVDKYVVHDTKLHAWQMASLQPLIKAGCSYKAAIESHLQARGYNLTSFYEQIDDAIVQLIVSNEKAVIKRSREFAAPTNFFELVRFDFVVDNDFDVWLMEVNLSPNLTPTKPKYEPNALGYEQVVHNVLKLVGAGSYYEFKTGFVFAFNIVESF